MKSLLFSAVFSGASMLAASAGAAGPVAIVEAVYGNPPGIELMDYVEIGRTLQLGPRDSVVLDYLSSCMREVIHGAGTVKVGVEQSDISSGKIERSKVDCEAGQMLQQTTGEPGDSASLIVRDMTPTPQFTIYGANPIFELHGIGNLVIERLDKKGAYFSIPIDARKLDHGAFLDFAANGRSLTPGGVYGAKWAGRLTVFRVAAQAKYGRAPVVSRLVKLASQS
jgi:hypothetical protein